MGDAPPVTVPTAVREPFDFGDEPFGDHDAIASVLDDAGRMLGVERNAGRASKAAPAVFDKAARSEYAAPSAAAAAAARKAVADELEALADGFPAEESLGVQIGTIGGSRATAAAAAAVATDAKAARRADRLEKYGRGALGAVGPRAAKKNVRGESFYARDLAARSRAKAEREAREAKARAPFVTAKYGVKLPAPVDSVQIGEKSAKARARRAALGAAKAAKDRPRPLSAGVWRVNANVAHDVTDPISVSFNDAKRARAVAALRAKEARAKRDPNQSTRAPRVDRSKYPSFKAWLDAQAERDARTRAQMPGYADAARAASAKRREAAYVERARLASGVPNAPGERRLPEAPPKLDVSEAPTAAPALNRFIALTEAFADRTATHANMSPEDQEKALMECAAEAAREAVEAAAGAASRASLAADAESGDEEEAAAAAALVGEAAYEDEALLRQVAEMRTPTKESKEPDAFILGQNPRGSPRALFGASAFGAAADAETGAEPEKRGGRRDAPPSKEAQLADALSKMTPEERLAARAKASKGWSGDFTGVFYDSKAAKKEGEDASESKPAPTWSEKPRTATAADGGAATSTSTDVSAAATAEKSEDGQTEFRALNPDALAVQFIGPNAAELAFRALNPDAPEEALKEAKDGERAAYASPGAVAARDAAARAAEGLDPSDPASVAQCVARLAEMGIEFFGKQADELAFKAVFPDREVPSAKGTDASSAASAAQDSERAMGPAKDAFDPAVPLAHQTGAAGLAVEFIGANAEELRRRALGGDEAEAREEEASADAADAAVDSNLANSTVADSNPGGDAFDAVLDAVPADGSDLSLPLPAAQEAAWSKAAVAAPGTSAAPATLEANLADAQTAASDVAAAEARAAAAFAEAERVDDAIDAGSGAAVPAALVAPLAEDTLRDAGAPGGGES